MRDRLPVPFSGAMTDIKYLARPAKQAHGRQQIHQYRQNRRKIGLVGGESTVGAFFNAREIFRQQRVRRRFKRHVTFPEVENQRTTGSQHRAHGCDGRHCTIGGEMPIVHHLDAQHHIASQIAKVITGLLDLGANHAYARKIFFIISQPVRVDINAQIFFCFEKHAVLHQAAARIYSQRLAPADSHFPPQPQPQKLLRRFQRKSQFARQISHSNFRRFGSNCWTITAIRNDGQRDSNCRRLYTDTT